MFTNISWPCGSFPARTLDNSKTAAVGVLENSKKQQQAPLRLLVYAMDHLQHSIQIYIPCPSHKSPIPRKPHVYKYSFCILLFFFKSTHSCISLFWGILLITWCLRPEWCQRPQRWKLNGVSVGSRDFQCNLPCRNATNSSLTPSVVLNHRLINDRMLDEHVVNLTHCPFHLPCLHTQSSHVCIKLPQTVLFVVCFLSRLFMHRVNIPVLPSKTWMIKPFQPNTFQ